MRVAHPHAISTHAHLVRRLTCAATLAIALLTSCFPKALDPDIEGGDTTPVSDAVDSDDEATATDVLSEDVADVDHLEVDADACPTPCDDGIPCTIDLCVNGRCESIGSECECRTDDDCPDSNLCDGINRCGDLRTCVVVPSEDCPKLDEQCRHNVCVPATGECVPEVYRNGDDCDDGAPCTEGDTCQLGVCQGAVKVCTHPLPCAETACDEPTGECRVDLSECQCDSNDDCEKDGPCNGIATCDNGFCKNGAPVVCQATGDVCRINACDEATGQCKETLADGSTSCNDHDSCTPTSHCDLGFCVGTPIDCSHPASCTVNSCDPATGACVHDTSACACSSDLDCDDGKNCNGDETCDQTTYTCAPGTHLPSSATCSDAQSCTTGDHCQDGDCVGTPVVCSAIDACHAAGVCQAATGTCTSPKQPDNTPCDEGNRCTLDDHCVDGTCVRTDLQCEATDDCHSAGVCNPSTGACSSPNAPPTTGCDDGDYCTVVDRCQSGSCVGSGLPNNATNDWNVAFEGSDITGIAHGPNGGTWAVFVVYASRPLVAGPTVTNGTLTLQLGPGEETGIVFGLYDASGHLLSLTKAITIPTQITTSWEVIDTDDGFALKPGMAAEYHVPGGTIAATGAEPNSQREVLFRYAENGALLWSMTFDSTQSPRLGPGIASGSSISFGLIQAANVLILTHLSTGGSGVIGSTTEAQVVTITETGSLSARPLQGTPNTFGTLYVNGVRIGDRTYFWYPFAGTQDFSGTELTSGANGSYVVGKLDGSGGQEWVISADQSTTPMFAGDVTTNGIVWVQAVAPGLELRDAHGPIHRFGASRIQVVALTKTGELAWTKPLTPAQLSLDTISVRPFGAAMRVFGVARQPFEFDGSVVAGTDPGPNRVGNLVAEIDGSGNLRFAELAATGPSGFQAVFGSVVVNRDGSMTFAGARSGDVTTGIDLKRTESYPTIMTFISRVNSAGALSCE